MRLIINKKLSKKIRGLVASSASINNISQNNYNIDLFKETQKKLIDLCKTRFKNPDKLISSKNLSRYNSFFRDTLKLNLIEVKPMNQIYGTLMLSKEEIEIKNPIEGLINYLSGAVGYPIFIFDADLIKSDMNIRYAKENEKFKGEKLNKFEILDGKEVVISDNSKIILKYPYDIAKDVKINNQTKNILLIICGVPGIVGLNLLWALKLSVNLITKIFSGKAEPILQELAKNE